MYVLQAPLRSVVIASYFTVRFLVPPHPLNPFFPDIHLRLFFYFHSLLLFFFLLLLLLLINLAYEESVRELHLFSLSKRKIRRDFYRSV